MPKKQNRERIFLGELKNTFQQLGAYWFKIPDSPVYSGMKTRFTVPKPFDAFMLYEGTPIAIEAKYLPDYAAFGIKKLTESQITGLCDFQAAGGRSFVFLNIRRKPDREENVERINRLIVFDWTDLRGTQKNFGKSELQQLPYFKGSNGLFDLEHKFSNILKGEPCLQ